MSYCKALDGEVSLMKNTSLNEKIRIQKSQLKFFVPMYFLARNQNPLLSILFPTSR